MALPALVFVGLLLVVLGILEGGSIPFLGLGTLALLGAGAVQLMRSRSP